MELPEGPARQNLEASQGQEEGAAGSVFEMSVQELERTLGQLQDSLEQARRFVGDQEGELAEQVEAIAALESQLQSAREGDRQSLLEELADEKERRDLLAATLVGQRHNLRQKELACQQYWQLLQGKKRSLTTAGDGRRGRRSGRTLLLVVSGSIAIAAAAWFAFHRFLSSAGRPLLGVGGEIQEYQERLQRHPDDLKTLEALTVLYLERGQLEAARPLMEKIVRQNPQSLEWQLNLANLYELTDRLPEAEAIYDKILASNGNHFQALLGKATLRSKQGDIEAARSLFQKAERLSAGEKQDK